MRTLYMFLVKCLFKKKGKKVDFTEWKLIL